LLDQTNHSISHRFTFTYENVQVYRGYPLQAYAYQPMTLYGEHLDKVIRLYMGGIQVDYQWIDRTLKVSEPLSGDILLMDKYFNLIQTSFTFTQIRIEAAICFLSGTLIHTDQGPLEIQKLSPGNTVYGKEIRGITETYYVYDQLVCIEPHAFRTDYPYRRTVMSRHHKIWLHGKMVEAQSLVGIPGVSLTPYHHEKLYNVLLDTEGRMNVQGMICETLDPANPIAKRFTWTLP
jgi:hypothetical protein